MLISGIFFEFEKLDELILNAGIELWRENFKVIKPLHQKGGPYRYIFAVNRKEAILNVYHKKDRTISIQSQGQNSDLSDLLVKKLDETAPYRDNGTDANYSVKIDDSTFKNLKEYLKSIEVKFENPVVNHISKKIRLL